MVTLGYTHYPSISCLFAYILVAFWRVISDYKTLNSDIHIHMLQTPGH